MTAFDDLLQRGGPVIWAIAALSVVTLRRRLRSPRDPSPLSSSSS